MNLQIPSLKPSAEWVTGLTDKYRFNPNVRTTVHIILLQVGLTVISIVVFGWAIHYAQEDTISSIAGHIKELMTGNVAPDALPQSILQVRYRTYMYVFSGMILLNLIFGYLIAQFALRPTQETISFQKRFIGNVAHEIRTPLAIMKTSTEVALFDPSLPPDIRETMEGTIVELDRISETINNLLSFDSLTRPKTMQFSPVDLSLIAATVIERHNDLAESRGITLVSEVTTGTLVSGNATALDQVVNNLTKNALNYTPADKDGKVTVAVNRNQRDQVVVEVIDTGIGIDQKDLYHVFEPFYRADTSRARGIGTGSSGLGLAIVNEIVRLHHGTITLRSSVGHGTTIKIAFPSAPIEDNDTRQVASPTGDGHEATIAHSSEPLTTFD
ncbi:MAG: Two-component system, OmpR family, phosphate regulon sensor histidine kinase PhoR [Parcubacteria group bacterium]|nr:Two-component system, OmpR family, phosphate regulon sensor histidine kinase PhoR [Parcubacteria group bacterium]